MSNDFVVMEKNICPVCGVIHEYNTGILIDKRMRAIDPDKAVTGYSMCEEHQKLKDDGYVALIEIDPNKSSTDSLQNIYRLGGIVHIRQHVFDAMFDIGEQDGIAFIDTELFNRLQEMSK